VVVDSDCAMYEYLPKKTRKYGRTCTTFFSLGLWKEISALDTLSPGFPFFDPSMDTTQHKNAIWRAMANAGDAAGVPNVHAHRFRNSFAVNALNNGARIEDVSKWLGHSSVRTTEQFYLPWVKSRQDALRNAWVKLNAPATLPVRAASIAL